MRKQYVANPEHWYWSSANPQSVIKTEIVETKNIGNWLKKPAPAKSIE